MFAQLIWIVLSFISIGIIISKWGQLKPYPYGPIGIIAIILEFFILEYLILIYGWFFNNLF
jgi:hypothetical protein